MTLVSLGPYVEKKVTKGLNDNRGNLIHLEEYEYKEFIRTLERMRIRRPYMKLKKNELE